MSPMARARAFRLIVPMILLLSYGVGVGAGPVAAAGKGQGFQGRLWTKTLQGPGGGADSTSDMAVSPDGSTVFVTGTSYVSLADLGDYLTVAYNAVTGVTRWVARFNGSATGDDNANALAVSPDGATLFVTGTVADAAGSDYVTIAYDVGTGNKRWIARYRGTGAYNFGYAIAVSPDGSRVFVSGEASGGQNTVAYDAATGTQLWPPPGDKRASGGSVVYALAVSPDSSTVFATGFATGASFDDYQTVGYDAATGAVKWLSRYNGPGNSVDDALAIGVSPDGTKVFVTGSSWNVSRDFATVAYDASSGTQVWVSRYDGPAASYDDAWDLSVSPDGSRVFVTGDSDGVGTSYDFATIAYAATAGAEQWVARYSSGTNAVDEAYGVRPSPDGGTVFVTGWSDAGAGGVGYATLAYDAITGTQTGLELASNGQASLVRVSPDGSTVFVTGSQGGTVNATTTNYGTIAYLVTP